MSVLTLLSDFGLKDAYVAQMKAVILSIHPQARIIDITHEIEKFNIIMGAFVLATAAPYFPEGTIHVTIIDPGVGTKRRPIVVETERSFYVGPDNGVLMLAAQKEGIIHVYQITRSQFTLPRVSRTFHGRDIFAPVAAHLARGNPPFRFGPEISDYELPGFSESSMERGELFGEVLYIDDFGNVISNISKRDLKELNIREGSHFRIKLNHKVLLLKFCSAYGEVPAKNPLAIIGSSDFLEISVNQGNAAAQFNTRIGDPILISLKSNR